MHSNNFSFLIILKFIDSRLWLQSRVGNCYKCIWRWPIKRNVLPYFHQRKGCGSHGKVNMADTFYMERNRPFVHEWPKGWCICCLVFPHLCCCLETDLAIIFHECVLIRWNYLNSIKINLFPFLMQFLLKQEVWQIFF